MTANISEKFINYNVNSRNVSIDKLIADKYSDIVCPITEHLLTTLIKVFGNGCNDEVLSLKIETDMKNELKEYGF